MKNFKHLIKWREKEREREKGEICTDNIPLFLYATVSFIKLSIRDFNFAPFYFYTVFASLKSLVSRVPSKFNNEASPLPSSSLVAPPINNFRGGAEATGIGSRCHSAPKSLAACRLR